MYDVDAARISRSVAQLPCEEMAKDAVYLRNDFLWSRSIVDRCVGLSPSWTSRFEPAFASKDEARLISLLSAEYNIES
jgi:hypothetical protein